MREMLRAALQKCVGEKLEFEIRRQSRKDFPARGEYSSNIALALAAKIKSTPAAAVAASIIGQLERDASLENISCAFNKGFLNFRMNDDLLHDSIARALSENGRYGATSGLARQRVNVEFVSADPTGPLHLHHARIAVAGDALCRLLALQGADVTREYFLNDIETSSKMRLLGESVAAFYGREFGRDQELPEGALDDEFVHCLATQIAAREGNKFLLRPDSERVSAFAHEAREAAVQNQKESLRALNVNFDVWSSESALYRDGRVASVIEKLQSLGHVYESGGALWLKTTSFGDEADRPLRRKSGEYTYLASDIAYHAYRFERGFDLLINIWTVQHEQYLSRTRAALRAANYPAEKLEGLTCESTRLLRDGSSVGDGDSAASLELALDEIGAENLRFLLLLPDWNEVAHIEIESARRDDESNPAYAARLLPSRLSTLIGQSEAAGNEASSENWTESERQLARFVAIWPDEIATATSERRPQRVARFVLEMAQTVRELLSASQPARSTSAGLLRAAHVTAENALRVLGIEPRDNF